MKGKGMDEVFKEIGKDPKFRRELARRSLFWFFALYLEGHIEYPSADFHRQLFETAQDDGIKSAVIIAFRGSGKTTIMSLAYPIWAMVTGAKKYIIILSRNQSQARQILSNIRRELEENGPLISHFGPFKEASNQWSSHSLVIDSYNTRIDCMSTGESIRGKKHRQYRPDLFILDDVEDLGSVKFKESRDKTFEWFSREVIPSGDINTKIIIIGNKIHEDCLTMRLKAAIEEGGYSSSKYYEYPLVDIDGNCLWKEKFSGKESIDALRASLPSDVSFEREYLLKYVPQEEQVIPREFIQYYEEIPKTASIQYTATAIDLAISESQTADYTAMVSAKDARLNGNKRIYILPHPLNKRMGFPETMDKAMQISRQLGNGIPTKLYVEDVAYQASIIQELNRRGYPAHGVKPQGQDKRARLSVVATFIKNGTVLFPKHGCEELIDQLVNFGYEKHDDLADAFAILVLKMVQGGGGGCMILWNHRPGREI